MAPGPLERSGCGGGLISDGIGSWLLASVDSSLIAVCGTLHGAFVLADVEVCCDSLIVDTSSKRSFVGGAAQGARVVLTAPGIPECGSDHGALMLGIAC